MNDLFTGSFKKYTDQNRQVDKDDVEAGREFVKLDKFFEDVEYVRSEIKNVEMLYQKLHEANEENKTADNTKTMKVIGARMDSDVQQVLKLVKFIKGKLEALERSNAASRNIPGCGPGSSVDRARTLVVSALGKKLKDMMDEFQNFRIKMQAEYKETVDRRYFTITGQNADEETIEKLISSGNSESLLQKAIQDQGRGEISETISEIQERHDAVKEIEKKLMELHEIFLDMGALVEDQNYQINGIERHVAQANSFVRNVSKEVQEAKQIQKTKRQWICIAMFAVLVGIVIIMPLFPMLVRNITNTKLMLMRI